MSRLSLALAFAAVVATGLVWRLVPLGLPAVAVKWGGSILWGAMVYVLVLLAWPRLAGWRGAAIAALIAIAVETSRLVSLPWLDAFRLTLAGKLLLGRIFSPWNLVAYAAGIAAAMLVEARIGRGRRAG